jgi:hypothetical protein
MSAMPMRIANHCHQMARPAFTGWSFLDDPLVDPDGRQTVSTRFALRKHRRSQTVVDRRPQGRRVGSSSLHAALRIGPDA